MIITATSNLILTTIGVFMIIALLLSVNFIYQPASALKSKTAACKDKNNACGMDPNLDQQKNVPFELPFPWINLDRRKSWFACFMNRIRDWVWLLGLRLLMLTIVYEWCLCICTTVYPRRHYGLDIKTKEHCLTFQKLELNCVNLFRI